MSLDEIYPRTLSEFDRFFPDEEECARYLVQIRWPDGFICPKCEGKSYWLLKSGLLECSKCGRQTSVTSGTVLHGTRKPLKDWLRAIWWIATQKTGGSAKGLKRILGFGSYQTAWAWLQKLKRGMVCPGRELLQGPVEVDYAFIGGKEAGVKGRQSFKKARIVVGVEVKGLERKITGRARVRHVKDFSADSLVPFVVENVVTGSNVITDGWSGYKALRERGFLHEVRVTRRKIPGTDDLLPNVHRVVALLKRWLLGTHHGAVQPKHLQHYLDEFTFRHNRRKSRHVGKIFYRLLQGVCETTPESYWKLIGREAPDQPLHIVGP